MHCMDCMTIGARKQNLQESEQEQMLGLSSRNAAVGMFEAERDDLGSCWALLRREAGDTPRGTPKSRQKTSPRRGEAERLGLDEQAGLYKSNLSLFSNSTTAFITTTSPSRSTASQFHGTPHQAITFQNSPREIDIDEACERFPPRRPTTTTTKSVRRSLFPTSINDSGLGASFEDHPPSSFSEDGVESCDEVLMEEIKEAMVELDLSEHEKSKKAEASKPHEKMVVAYSYTGRDDDEVTVRSGDLVTVMYEDSHWFLVETEDMRFGFVPRDCCIPPYSVMMSDTMVTCAGSVACLSVLSEDELLSAYTPSRGSTLDRGRLMRVAPKEKPRTAPRSLDVSCEQLCCTPDRKRALVTSPSSDFSPDTKLICSSLPHLHTTNFPPTKPATTDRLKPSTGSSEARQHERRRPKKTRYIALKTFVAEGGRELSVSSGQWLHSCPTTSENDEVYCPQRENRYFHSDWKWVRCPYTKNEGFVPVDVLVVSQ